MSNVVYVPLADIAAACGIKAYTLQTKHLPAHWAVPRDYRLLPPHYTCLVSEAALPDLVQELRSAGLTEAAERLDQWRAEIATPESHEDFTARHSATPREPDGLWFKEGQYE
jgi:hypothetical protein